MAGRKSKATDLQVRIRYQNPLPPPPFPPKLLSIPTDLNRFASYDTLRPIEAEREIPLLVDAELGMYLESGQGDPDYWEGDRSKVAPAMVEIPLDEDDLDLLGEAAAPNAAGAPGLLGTPSSIPQHAKKANGVSWLRRTEYLSAGDQGTPQRVRVDERAARAKPESLSREDRIQAILASFEAANAPLEELSHPTVPSRKASKTYPVLPDEDIWPNTYKLVRYPDNPSTKDRHSQQLEDLANGPGPRTETAIIRVVRVPDDDERMVYYQLPDEEAAQNLLVVQNSLPTIDEPDLSPFPVPPAPHPFHRIRDYETASKRLLMSECLLSIDEGDLDSTRSAGAYFAPLQEFLSLRKRRPRRGEDPMDYGPDALAVGLISWDEIHVALGLRPELMPQEDADLFGPGRLAAKAPFRGTDVDLA